MHVLSDEDVEEVTTPGWVEPAPGKNSSAPGCARRRQSAASRLLWSDAVRFKTYYEQIKGVVHKDEVAFPDNLDFHFKIPLEVEDIEM